MKKNPKNAIRESRYLCVDSLLPQRNRGGQAPETTPNYGYTVNRGSRSWIAGC